jgi:hypothetical protein|eukprot:COSAG01_NODE_5466_length_4243_cov_77.924469_5_plen_49_part_00
MARGGDSGDWTAAPAATPLFVELCCRFSCGGESTPRWDRGAVLAQAGY